MGWRLTKYIAYKILDSEDHEDLKFILEQEVQKHYAIVHEDYVVLMLQSELKQGMYSVCSSEQTKGNKQRKGRV